MDGGRGSRDGRNGFPTSVDAVSSESNRRPTTSRYAPRHPPNPKKVGNVNVQSNRTSTFLVSYWIWRPRSRRGVGLETGVRVVSGPYGVRGGEVGSGAGVERSALLGIEEFEEPRAVGGLNAEGD